MSILDWNHVVRTTSTRQYSQTGALCSANSTLCIAAGMACKRRLNDKRFAAVSYAPNICYIPYNYSILLLYSWLYTVPRIPDVCMWVCGCGCVHCLCVRVCSVYSGDRGNVGELSCRRGDGGAGEQMTLTAGRNNLAASKSRSIHRSRLRERSRPKNADKIDKKR